MVSKRRTIRKTKPAVGHEPDGRLWPLVLAFCVLGGFLSGTVLAYLRLDDPRWYANAWTYLIAIPLVIVASLVALAVTGNRLLKRTMQLAWVLGLIWHLGLFIMAIETDVFQRVWTEVLASTKQPPREAVEEVPHYTPRQYDARRQLQREFNAPVRTEEADAVVESATREADPVDHADVARQRRARPDQSRPVPRPNVTPRREVNQALPRRREQGGKLSRRDSDVSPHPMQVVAEPDQVPQSQRRPDVVEPGDLSTRKLRQPRESAAASPAAASAAPEQNRRAQVTRKSRSAESPRQQAAAAALPRSETRDGMTPRADVSVANKPAIAQENRPAAVEPNNTAARKEESRSVASREITALPMEERVAEPSTRRRNPRQPAPRRRELARTPEPAERRQPRLTARPHLTAEAEATEQMVVRSPRQAAEEAGDRRPTAQELARPTARSAETAVTPAEQPATNVESPRSRSSAETQKRAVTRTPSSENRSTSATLAGRKPVPASGLGPVAQRVSDVSKETAAKEPAEPAPRALAATRARNRPSAAGNAADKEPVPSVDAAGGAKQRQVARQRRQPNTAAPRPSLNPLADAESVARRARRRAGRPSSPTSAENPVRHSSTAKAAPEPAPTPLALDKAQVGTAGRGAAPNLAAGDPAGETQAKMASGSAERDKATQALDPGPALAPQSPALVRDGRAGRARPNAVLKATPPTPATLAGNERPDAVNASASAALTEAASDAAREKVTAAKGALEVDVGPTTRVSRSGIARAAGGGQPRRSAGAELAKQQPRTAREERPTASLSAEAVSPDVAAPAAQGGGKASLADLDSNAEAAVHARNAPEPSALGGPEALEGGKLAIPTSSRAESRRRAANAADGPQLARASEEELPRVARKANRNRQLQHQAGVADVRAGTADDRDQREKPRSRLAAAAATAVDQPRSAEETKTSGVGKAEASERQTVGAKPGQGVYAARAEAVDAAKGPPRPGGGTESPARATLGPELAANIQADPPKAAGAPTSAGRKNAEPQSTQGPLLTRLAAGVDAPRSEAAVGALPAELSVDAMEGKVAGKGPARRGRSNSQMDGPAIQSDLSSSPLDKRTANKLPISPSARKVAKAELPKKTRGGNESDLDPGPVAEVPRRGETSELAGSTLPVAIDAQKGSGGLDRQVTMEVGVPDRRASDTSEQVQLNPARFDRQQVGGQPELNPAAVVAAEPFQRRARREQQNSGSTGGSGPETEEAIELGLAYLSRARTSDGRWTLDETAQRDGLPRLSSDTAATGLALLAFQGAGYNHREYRYAADVRKGIEFLVNCQKANGDLYLPMDKDSNRVVSYYSHSIAALALCEAYGMTQDAALREPAQAALDFIVDTQHPERGGWRYSRHLGSDTSVTGWMMMALKSGDLANLDVPDDTYEQIEGWLDRAQASSDEPHLYCYNPYAPDTPEQRRGRRPTPSMTSVGLLMRLYSGWRRDNSNMVRGAEYLLERPPAVGTASNPLRDTYYWYYATQVMFHMGGQYWNAWNQRLHPLLIGSQIRDGEMAGSWAPDDPVPDRWAPFAGRLYVTTMNLLSLEVTYRYLPLYEDTGR